MEYSVVLGIWLFSGGCGAKLFCIFVALFGDHIM